MSALGKFLRVTSRGHAHWSPGCEMAHVIPFSWTFNGNPEAPEFSPSVKHTSSAQIVVKDGEWTGEWTGEWKTGEDGKPLPFCCHYFVRGKTIEFCGDCTHGLSGRTVGLPPWPEGMRVPE